MISNVSTQLPPLLAPNGEPNAEPKGVKVASAPEKTAKIGEVSKEQQSQVDKLKKIDQEVRAHEQAHKNAGGQYAGSASFTYTVGPDGKRYAVGGEVSIDTAKIEGDPEATIAKLNVVISAALAPAKPSGQDRKVAAAAVAARNEARAELTSKKKEEQEEVSESDTSFDINDFGDVAASSVEKAYANGNDLSQNNASIGLTISIAS